MKITPLEIKQKGFEKKFRGYDKEEVKAFMFSLANEWERMQEEVKDMRRRLIYAEKEVQKLREVETSLFKTLKTAEETGTHVINQAKRAAELNIQEANMRSERVISDAKSKAKSVLEKADFESSLILQDLKGELDDLKQNCRDIENQRQNAIHDLKNLSLTLAEKLNTVTKENMNLKFGEHEQKMKNLSREHNDRVTHEKDRIESMAGKRLPNTSAQQKDVNKKMIGDSSLKRANNPPIRKIRESGIKPTDKRKNPPIQKITGRSSFFDQF